MADLTPGKQRRRWINVGEIVAVAGLLVSGLALWNSWGRDANDKPPTTIVERQRAIPLALRGTVEQDGRLLIVSPVEAGHALDSLTVSVPGKPDVAIGSDGRVAASDIEQLLGKETKEASGTLRVTIAARYVEAGADRSGSGGYRLSWRWDRGGLLGGRSLRLTGFNRG